MNKRQMYNVIRTKREDPEDSEQCWFDNATFEMTLEQANEVRENLEFLHGKHHDYTILKVEG